MSINVLTGANRYSVGTHDVAGTAKEIEYDFQHDNYFDEPMRLPLKAEWVAGEITSLANVSILPFGKCHDIALHIVEMQCGDLEVFEPKLLNRIVTPLAIVDTYGHGNQEAFSVSVHRTGGNIRFSWHPNWEQYSPAFQWRGVVSWTMPEEIPSVKEESDMMRKPLLSYVPSISVETRENCDSVVFAAMVYGTMSRADTPFRALFTDQFFKANRRTGLKKTKRSVHVPIPAKYQVGKVGLLHVYYSPR